MIVIPAHLVQRDERGASSVEYALLATLIAGVIVATLVVLGPVVAGLFEQATEGW